MSWFLSLLKIVVFDSYLARMFWGFTAVYDDIPYEQYNVCHT